LWEGSEEEMTEEGCKICNMPDIGPCGYCDEHCPNEECD